MTTIDKNLLKDTKKNYQNINNIQVINDGRGTRLMYPLMTTGYATDVCIPLENGTEINEVFYFYLNNKQLPGILAEYKIGDKLSLTADMSAIVLNSGKILTGIALRTFFINNNLVGVNVIDKR